ncbi:hypothetical protein N0V83_009724 [Neocucurbitaria cava]|uniref:Uncharacterized protein n=1 Tax=Neocucurbitaria cava TaxID=798079 RepID=A0A9W9CHY1_9PLEO|nr:hypothetical protein N0V83_009724 [Neocucurbitaria cava]
MLRRSHKKSRGGCLECFTSEAPPTTSGASSRSGSPGNLKGPDVTPISDHSPLTPSSLYNAELSQLQGDDSRHNRSLDEPLNFNHLELLAHLTIDKNMFNLGVGLDDYYASLALGLKTSLKWPYLMHQILAYAARHLAFIHPEQSEFYLQQAVTLQTRAVSLFTAIPLEVDQSNCMPILFFSSVLGHHLLADTLGKRDPSGVDGFVDQFVQCAQTYKGVHSIAISAWPLLMESELAPILTRSANFTSREPRGDDCQCVNELVDCTTELCEDDKKACREAIKYLQVGFDAAFEEEPRDGPPNRYQMISEWAMLVPPEFTSLLAAKKPEALVILTYYAALLHCGKHLWQVGDAGTYVIGIIGDYLGAQWDRWLEYPRQTIARSLE